MTAGSCGFIGLMSSCLLFCKRKSILEHPNILGKIGWRPVEEGTSIPAAALLESWSDSPWTNGVQVDHMEDMEKLVVRTGNSLYEIIIIDGPSGEILVRGGQYFPELTPARLTGATLGGSFCKLRGNLCRLSDGALRERAADRDYSCGICRNSRLDVAPASRRHPNVVSPTRSQISFLEVRRLGRTNRDAWTWPLGPEASAAKAF